MNEEKKQSGFLILNKPAGPTSFDMIYKLRKITGIKKIGHAGTLDPFASGVLIIAIGRESTKQIDNFVKKEKEYIATLHLGAETNTYDTESRIQNIESGIKNIPEIKISETLKKFIGEQDQIPPMFSAKKVGGKKLYELARKGIEIERKPSRVNIYELGLKEYKWPILKIRVKCSSGTYIRTLGFDIGRKLGCGAYLEELQRTAIGDFKIKKAVEINDLNKNNWQSFIF